MANKSPWRLKFDGKIHSWKRGAIAYHQFQIFWHLAIHNCPDPNLFFFEVTQTFLLIKGKQFQELKVL